jgi:hypothetical protein
MIIPIPSIAPFAKQARNILPRSAICKTQARHAAQMTARRIINLREKC